MGLFSASLVGLEAWTVWFKLVSVLLTTLVAGVTDLDPFATYIEGGSSLK